jgi:hypothetical protein
MKLNRCIVSLTAALGAGICAPSFAQAQEAPSGPTAASSALPTISTFPEGTTFGTRRRWGLFGAGAATLAISYSTGIANGFLIQGFCDEDCKDPRQKHALAYSAIPIAGPVIAGYSPRNAGALPLMVPISIVQLAGVAMMVAGATGRERVVEHNDARAHFLVVPTASQTSGGVAAVGRF